MTPREEFEEMFGEIIDEQWQWLKEFVERNQSGSVVDWDRVSGFIFDGRVMHPSEVRVIQNARVISLSLDKEPNAFGYGIESVEILKED